MKKIITFSFFLATLLTFGQVPQGISYQAIALNSSGNPVVSSNVGIRLSVLDNSATGIVLYTESHTKMTNAQGLFNLVIGQGTPTTGTFSAINWGTNYKFLKVEMDAAGGTNYVLVGTTQLLSVPYALAAGSLSGSNANDSIENNKFSNFAFYNTTDSKTYAFNQNTGTWVGVTGSGTITASSGNFAFYNTTDSKTYAFNKNTNIWIGITGSGTITASNGNFAFYNTTDSKTYAFNQNTGTWVGVTGSGTITASNGNFAFYNTTDSKTYAFSQNTGTWIGVTGSGTITASNGNFAFYNTTNSKTYAFYKNGNSWIGITGSGTIISSPSN